MILQPPKIEHRTADELAREVRALIGDWPVREEGELATALVNIFARYGEMIGQRLNCALEKNFLAFLDLLGLSCLPPQAARVPLTFYLSAENAGQAVVPARTQVAAPPGKGEQQPVVFQTLYELVVVAAKLESLMARDSLKDQYTIFNSVLGPATTIPSPFPPAAGATAEVLQPTPPVGGELELLPHTLYIGVNTYAHWPKINQVRLHLNLGAEMPAQPDPRILRWEICSAPVLPPGTPKAAEALVKQFDDESLVGIPIIPFRDDTDDMTKSGEIVFMNVPEIQMLSVNGIMSHWLRCRLLTPITHEHKQTLGALRQEHLPRIASLETEIRLERTALAIEKAFVNQLKVDPTKDFFPFGEKPKFGDTLYLSNALVFSNPDAFITIQVVLTNPSGGVDLPLPPVTAHGTRLEWEFWDGQSWAELGTAELGRRVRFTSESDEGSTATDFSDSTQTFSQSGSVSFRFKKAPQESAVNGERNYWIRVRLVGGDYGTDVRYEHEPGKGYVAIPANFAPPSIHSITIDYTVQRKSPPDAISTYNDFSWALISPEAGEFQPFKPAQPDHALYFGFALPDLPATPIAPVLLRETAAARKFPNRSMTVYAEVDDGEAHLKDALNTAPSVWEYWNGTAWLKWTVRDDTHGMQRSELVRFLAPDDFALKNEFGLDRYWLRLLLQPGQRPELRRALLNTTIAAQVASIENELLGTSTGRPRQRFRTTRAPVLEGQQLEVLELAVPSPLERARIIDEEGEDAVRTEKKPSGLGEEIWVRWHEVQNFYGSSSRDRHYVLERITGEVRFGDGVNGQIPPVLPANIRMVRYQSGGGAAGNKPAGTITQLKSAVPYIEKVTNWEAAAGAMDAESTAELLDRGPRILRHRHRAVTAEDFEDLAMLASPEVARAKCVSLHDLVDDPAGAKVRPGSLSLIVVPRSSDATPMPDLDLLDRVRTYLDERRVCGPELILLGPRYIAVDVQVEIAVQDVDVASEVELRATLALKRFLHPLIGGSNSAGWDFGAKPHRSDLYALLEHIPGVSHVARVEVRVNHGSTPGRMEWSLVSCGKTNVNVVLES